MTDIARKAVRTVSLALALSCSVVGGLAGAATYYVDYDRGSDSNAGLSAEAPFRHCPGDPKAAESAAAVPLQPGDTVIFRGGVIYRGSLQVKSAGEEGKPITYDGNTEGTFGGGPAILDGSEPITGWRRCASAEECGGNPNYRSIYCAQVPSGQEGLSALAAGLVQDDRMLYPAQYPNPDDPFYADDRSSFLKAQSVTPTTLTDARLDDLGGPGLVGAYAYLDASSNLVVYQRITGYDPATKTITFDKPGRTPVGGYALANSLHAKVLDRPGEYVFVEEPDAEGMHTVYVWPWDGRDPAECRMTRVVRPMAIEFARNQHHVTVQGFVIRSFHAAIHANRVKALTVRDNEFTNIRQTNRAAVVGVSDTEDFVFDHNYVHHTPKMHGVITHTGKNVVYSRNTIHRVGQSPLIFYRVTGGQITDNKVTECYGVHSNAFSIYLGDRDILIARNEVRRSTRPLTVQSSENVFVIGNVFAVSGGAAVGLWAGPPHRRLYFLNNTIYSPGAAIYVGATGMTDCVFKNNIISGFEGVRIREGNEFSHNIYLRTGRRLQEGEMLMDDPRRVFADAAGADLQPVPRGPAVDMGTDVSDYHPTDLFPDFDFDVDIAGAPRRFGPRWDIGAYEVRYPPGTLDGRPPIPTGLETEPTVVPPVFKRVSGAAPIVIPAIGFTGEGGGTVQIMSRERLPFIDFLLQWDAEGHWLEWTIEDADAGEYDVTLRYATRSPAPRRMDVNGQVVQGLESFTMDATGGWSNWMERRLPARVSLRPGSNVLRLTSLGGMGLNLDSIRLSGPGREDIVISAGSFTGQGGGQVTVRPGVRHGYFYMWNADGHWLEWAVEGAAAGKYEVVIRYSTMGISPRELRVNGEVVKGLESFELERTDGWDNWQEASLPVPIVLKRGRNVLRITSLGGGGMNFDEIRLIPVE